MKYTFEKISIKKTKKWIDENGKKRQKTKEFFQTLNPFNKNSKGQVKTRHEIAKEIKERADEWFKNTEPCQVKPKTEVKP